MDNIATSEDMAIVGRRLIRRAARVMVADRWLLARIFHLFEKGMDGNFLRGSVIVR